MSCMASSGRLHLATSTRADGNMSLRYGQHDEVMQARGRFLERLGLPTPNHIMLEVEHGSRVVPVDRRDAHKGTVAAEALVTDDPTCALLLLTGDCLPITVCDKARGVFALAHAGWRPTGLCLLPRVIAEMGDRYGIRAGDLSVTIGPSIRAASYVVEEALQLHEPAWAPYLVRSAEGIHVDLVAYNIDQLGAAGVAREAIMVDPNDTAASEAYFSHYRSIRTGEPEGRMLTVAWLG